MFIGLAAFDSIAHFFDLGTFLIGYSAVGGFLNENQFNPIRWWYRMPLETQRCPQLIAELAQFNRKRNIKRIPKVFLSDWSNGVAIHTPRFDFFGWRKPELEIGLESMLVLSPYQIRGLLAHEWGHLSNPDEQVSVRLMLRLHQVSSLFKLLAKYKISWPAKSLERYLIDLLASFQALRRTNEYSADRIAAELVGKQAAARSLIGCSIFGNWVGEHYWKPLLAMTRHMPTPDVVPYACLYDFCRSHRFTAE